MLISSIYIYKTDGIPLITRHYIEDATIVDGLVTPFLAVISDRFEEITGEGVTELTLGDRYKIVFERFADILCAVVVSDAANIQIDLHLLLRRFYKRYYQKLNSNLPWANMSQIDNFVNEMEELLEINKDIVYGEIPNKILDTITMIEFDYETQDIISVLIRDKEVDLNRIKEEVDQNDHEIKEKLSVLIREGYLGVKMYPNKGNVYFTL
ncbi:MAG: hypothetical protein OEZ01_03570 [Candidatus Heimdallarchaeota archaeon]|nr:hypothetical protein [Candidatus Heimdallarchaeota archaeon]